jgi:signal transduction histidine kinase
MDLIQTVAVLQPIADQKAITLRSTIVNGFRVKADRNMLTTVVRNLLGNALKFTPRGGQVCLEASETHSGDKDGGMVTISVKDTGVGMNAAAVSRLFRLDVHQSTRGTDNEQGSGLGLIICREMVERNGGTIWAESQPQKGTTIAFTVPRCPAIDPPSS